MKISEIIGKKPSKINEYKSVPVISGDRLKKFKALSEHIHEFSPENVLKMIDKIYGSKY